MLVLAELRGTLSLVVPKVATAAPSARDSKPTRPLLVCAIVLSLAWSLGSVSAAAPTAASAAAPTAPVEMPVEMPVAPTDARTLLGALSTIDGLEARFVERKHLALLRAPLVSEGRLFYTRPGHLARIAEAPSPSTVRISPTSLEVSDASGSQRFDLRSRPEIKTFVESFVHVVAGDYDALASIYALGFAPGVEPGAMWLLTLTPLGSPLSDLIERLEIRGFGYLVVTIRVLEKKGDSTDIVMTSVDHRRVFTEQERLDLFALPPREPAE